MILMFLGGQPAADPFVFFSKFFTCTYFMYFICCIPVLNWINIFVSTETEKPYPYNFIEYDESKNELDIISTYYTTHVTFSKKPVFGTFFKKKKKNNVVISES
jgi:hypothetical protein